MLAMTPAWMLRSVIAAAGNALCPCVEVPGIHKYSFSRGIVGLNHYITTLHYYITLPNKM